MSDAHAHGHPPAPSGGGSKSGGGGGGTISLNTTGFIIAVIIMGCFCWQMNTGDGSSTQVQNKNDSTQVVVKKKKILDYSILVNFTDEYCESITIEEGKLFAFSRASTPYCTKNEKGFEKCGKAQEDISDFLGYDISKRTLWFKASSLDSIGEIYIDFFKLVEK